jgi:2'-5' RNA ligase
MIPEPRRLFIGLMPDRSVQSAIQRHCREWDWPETARMTPSKRYHITLQFLGEVGIAPEQRLRKALRQIEFEPLELELSSTGFLSRHIAVLRAAEHDGLRDLQIRVAAAVSAVGLGSSTDGKYLPHVTLARKAASARPPAAVRPIRWRVEAFDLVHSVLFPEAKPARYDVIERFAAKSRGELGPPPSDGQASIF